MKIEIFKKLLAEQVKHLQKEIINNKHYSNEEKIESIENTMLSENDLTEKEIFKNDEDLDLMQELRSNALVDLTINLE